MRQLIFLTYLLIFVACDSNRKETEKTASATSPGSKDSSIEAYPLPTFYSPTWQTGDQKNAVMVLNIGKAWMAGDVESFSGSFADSVSVYLANGDKLIGSRDSIIASMKNFRNLYSEVKSEIHSIVPLHHGDTKEDWVCIWLKEITTTVQGRKDSIELQESWRMNQAGKIELVYQYAATIKPSGK